LYVKADKEGVEVYVNGVMRIDYAYTSIAGYELGEGVVGLYGDSNTSFFKTFKISDWKEYNPLLNTKAQINAAGDAIRFVSSVDSLEYKEVGFEITIGDKTVVVKSKSVYTSILANGQEVLPTIFGEEAKYMFTYTIWSIPEDQKATEIFVRAFWVGMDDTMTYGETKVYSVNSIAAMSANA